MGKEPLVGCLTPFSHPKWLPDLNPAVIALRFLGRPFLNVDLADASRRLCKVTGRPVDRVLFCTTGTEAIESALKLARLATSTSKIIAATRSFHEFTMGALSV